MKLIVAVLASASAGVAVAQSGCQAQSILDACTSQLKPALQSCAAQDWNCQCEKANNLLTCYNNCPNDPNRSGVQSQVTQYCDAAKAYGSSSSSSGSMSMTASSSGGSSMASATGPTSSSASPTLPAGVTASSSQTGNAASATGSAINGSGTGAGSQVVPGLGASMGGLVAVVAGAVALL